MARCARRRRLRAAQALQGANKRAARAAASRLIHRSRRQASLGSPCSQGPGAPPDSVRANSSPPRGSPPSDPLPQTTLRRPTAHDAGARATAPDIRAVSTPPCLATPTDNPPGARNPRNRASSTHSGAHPPRSAGDTASCPSDTSPHRCARRSGTDATVHGSALLLRRYQTIHATPLQAGIHFYAFCLSSGFPRIGGE